MIEAALDGVLFDGRTAAATPVRVTIAGGAVRVTTASGEPLREEPLERVSVTEPFGKAPRQLRLPGGAVVEVADGAALSAALAAAGRGPGVLDRLEAQWPAALAAVALCVAALAAGYAYGLPALARGIASALPASSEARLGAGVLEVLDRAFLEPSTLTTPEQVDVEAEIDEAVRRAAPGVRYRVLFRSVRHGPGVNAFALPGGTIVVLDELVLRTDRDDRLLAVVGHELGHVARRHSTQALLKGAGVGAAASLLWGDFSGQVASIPAVFAMLDYSRDAEREADEDAVRFLRAAGRSALPMVEVLCLLESVERDEGFGPLPRALSSHPRVRERMAHVREVGGLEAGSDPCPAPRP